MKILISSLLLTFSLSTLSQDLDQRIQNVENGLHKQSIFLNDSKPTFKSLEEKMKDYKIPGASVAVINDGEVAWTKVYGIRNKNGDLVTTSTLFQCASIGKVITSLAVMKLVQEGKLDLDENVNNKLSKWKLPENELTKQQPVTLRHLLSHSAGLTDDYGFLGYGPKDVIPTLLQILDNEAPAKTKKSLEVKTLPGSTERYSGGGYLIIQLLIEEVTEMSFSKYITQNIFNPLKMNSSNYEFRPDETSNLAIASGHLSNGRPLKNKSYHIYPEQAAAGPWTTTEDIAKLILGIQSSINGEDDSIIKKELVAEYLSPQINNKGLGVNLKGIDKPEAFWHAGQNLGFTGLAYGLTGSRDGAVVLVNSDGGERFIQEFITSVASEYRWPIMRSYGANKISDELKEKLVGSYRDEKTNKNLSIVLEDDQLYMKVGEAKKGHQLFSIGTNHYTFKDAQDYYKLSFKTQEDETTHLVYTESIGKTLVLKKVN